MKTVWSGLKPFGAFFLFVLLLSPLLSAGCSEGPKKSGEDIRPAEKETLQPVAPTAVQPSKEETREPKPVEAPEPGVPVDRDTYRKMKEKAGESSQ